MGRDFKYLFREKKRDDLNADCPRDGISLPTEIIGRHNDEIPHVAAYTYNELIKQIQYHTSELSHLTSWLRNTGETEAEYHEYHIEAATAYLRVLREMKKDETVEIHYY